MIKANKLIITFLYLASFILIIWGYNQYIVPIYGYTGFEWHPNHAKIIESIAILSLVSYLLPTSFKKPSDLLLHLQLLFPITPMIVLYGVTDSSRYFLYITILAFMLIFFVASTIHLKKVRMGMLSPLLFGRMLLMLSWSCILSIVLFGGLRYFNLDLSKVYDFRSDAATNLPAIYGYISPLASKVLLPFSLLLAILNKDRFLALSAIVGSVMMMGLTNHKGPIFYPFSILVLYYILSKKNTIEMLLLGYLVIAFVSILDFMEGDVWIGNLMLRRVYLVPAHINYIYYDYFSSNPFYLWSQSKVSFGLLESKYSLDPSHLIGLEYYGSALTSANTGWIGSGYMNAGISGIFIYAVIVGLFFSLLNAYAKSIDKNIIVAIVFAPMLAVIMSTDLPAAFLNHGVILCIILLSLFSIKQPA